MCVWWSVCKYMCVCTSILVWEHAHVVYVFCHIFIFIRVVFVWGCLFNVNPVCECYASVYLFLSLQARAASDARTVLSVFGEPEVSSDCPVTWSFSLVKCVTSAPKLVFWAGGGGGEPAWRLAYPAAIFSLMLSASDSFKILSSNNEYCFLAQSGW